MPNIWVGGDWHLWNVNLRDERHPFRSKQNIEEFKQYLASKPIQPDDLFLVLGDLCDPEATDAQNLRDVIAAIPPCMKVLVKGNHDTAEDSLYLNAGFDLVTDIVLIHHMIFSHIPVYVSHEQLNVHAHLHSVKISVFDDRYVNVKNVDPCILLDDLLDRAMRQNKSEYEGVDNDRYIQNFFRNIEDTSHMDQPEERRIMDLSHLVPEYPMDENVLNEYIFNNPDEARMWLADDDTPPKPDTAPEGEEKDNRKYVQTNLNTFQEAAVVGPAVNTPEDLSKWMKRNIRYGNYRKLMTPAEVMDTGSGSCHDQVAFEYPILKRMKVHPKILFFIAINEERGTSGQTHSLIWWKNDRGKVYWFENSWGGNQGIHTFDSITEMKTEIRRLYVGNPDSKNNPQLVFQDTTIRNFKPGISLGDLVDAVYNGKKLDESVDDSEYIQTNLNVFQESTHKSTLDKNYKQKGKTSLSSLKRIDITEQWRKDNRAKYPWLKHIASSDKKVDVSAWMDGDNLVAAISVDRSPTKRDKVWIHNIHIETAYRGYGLSKQMLDYATRKYGANALTVKIDNKIAQKVYLDYGFKFGTGDEDTMGNNKIMYLGEAVDESETEYLEHPEMKDDIFNGEQIKFFQDQQTYKESLPDESVEVEQIDGYQFSLEEEIVFNDDDLLDEAVSENSKLYPVYVLLVHTGTKLSSAILKVTNAEFGHACISFDSSLKKMYSFGRKDPKNPFAGGFVMESLGEGFYDQKVMDKTHYAIYVVPCTKYQIEKMKKRLQYFIKNKSKFIFDFFGLITNYFGIVANPKLRYFCSRFVADILNAGANNKKKYIKEPSLMDPEDFKHTDFAHFVTGGMLCNYNPDEVNVITRGILKSQELIRKQTGKLQYHTFGEAATYSDKIRWYKNTIRNETVEEYERSTKELRICFTPDMRMKLDKENYEVFYAVYRHLITSFIDCGEYDVETRMELYGKLQSLVKFFQQYFFPSVTDPATNEFASVYTRLHAEMLRGLSVCRKKLDTATIPESVTYFQSGRTIPYLTETVYIVPY